ncbi:MFS transporter, NHS family, xanthosine permease [Mucilaginibacter oryzae]|uniref:MFS transporter, NHS family, xanthosine permease n=1 Tax=Mucilaginibacter oryzae TaxID=468058 RepID=A0A316HCM9_9SPHI|nr:nucleoside permease [Mucilaginibacter oryzae]PWK78894.1 MFS transporter, NHS family, xanthosine permease [Mucilaginibacter oryzae]
MNIKFRLILMNFMQFFIWGAWLLTVGAYWFQNKGWSGAQFGIIFSTMGISSIFMPAIAGIVSDRWVHAEKLYGTLHILGSIVLFCVPLVTSPGVFFWVILLNMIFYMPTLSLSIKVAYSALKEQGKDVVKVYPPIRVWGTVGFIAALLVVDVTKSETSPNQFYIASGVALALGLFSFTLPKCPPLLGKGGTKTLKDALGLNAFELFKTSKFAIFFAFSLLLGAALQLTNAYGTTYILDFAKNPAYKGLFAVEHSGAIISISQVSETLFILAIPFFLRKFGIKNVMLFSMIAWVLRFGLFAFGNPDNSLWMIILSCIVYGMAFDFFNISGSLFVETQTTPEIRGSAQGLFMMMVNGFGALFGSIASGFIIDKFFIHADGSKDWHGIWLTFAAYALAIAIVFPFVFKYKHNKALEEAIRHA